MREASPPLPYTPVYFRYFGRTALTAIGGATGRSYRFAGPGATYAVDPRDAPSLAQVPSLRRIANPVIPRG